MRCQAADLNGQTTLILAYDDLASINYFGEWRKAYWTTKYKTILEAISAAFADQKKVYRLGVEDQMQQKYEAQSPSSKRTVGRGLAPFIVFIRDVVLDVQL